MDTSDIVSIFLRGALGGRGRKRARRARNFLTGNRGFLTASTLLGAAGVAWGVYDSLKASSAAGAASTPGAAGAASPANPASAAGAAGAVVPPPIPGPTPATDTGAVIPDDVLRIVRLAVSASRADGTLSAEERALILQHAREAGIEAHVEREIAAPRPLAEIVGGVSEEQRREDLYVLAFTIVRADENVSGAERIYLAQLAHQLGLDTNTTARLERETAARIDQTPEDPGDTPQ